MMFLIEIGDKWETVQNADLVGGTCELHAAVFYFLISREFQKSKVLVKICMTKTFMKVRICNYFSEGFESCWRMDQLENSDDCTMPNLLELYPVNIIEVFKISINFKIRVYIAMMKSGLL